MPPGDPKGRAGVRLAEPVQAPDLKILKVDELGGSRPGSRRVAVALGNRQI